MVNTWNDFLKPPSDNLPYTLQVNTLDTDEVILVEPRCHPECNLFFHTNREDKAVDNEEEDIYYQHSSAFFFESFLEFEPHRKQIINLEFLLGPYDNGSGMIELLEKMVEFRSTHNDLYEFEFHLYIYHNFTLNQYVKFELPVEQLSKLKWHSFIFETDPLTGSSNLVISELKLLFLPSIPLASWLNDSKSVLKSIYLGKKLIFVSDDDLGISFATKFKKPTLLK